ncbi:MAG: hypothetical protein Q7U75_17405 [Desulfobacterales bacterium]|nr:hypothetical protein [Desulfobacterales bacterium]
MAGNTFYATKPAADAGLSLDDISVLRAEVEKTADAVKEALEAYKANPSTEGMLWVQECVNRHSELVEIMSACMKSQDELIKNVARKI